MTEEQREYRAALNGLLAALVLTSCVLLGVMAVRGHDIGGEIWGLVTAVFAVGASIATWSALRVPRSASAALPSTPMAMAAASRCASQ